MNRLLLPALAVILSLPAHGLAQAARLELRIVRQSGTLPGPITDIDVGGPYAATIGEVIRFEVQGRVLDLNLTDSIVPAGLSACGMSIVSDTSGYRFRRAELSRFEALLAGAEPPASIDSSGLPLGTAAGRAGMHAPFRTFQNSNVNFYPSNGILTNGNGVNVPDIDPITPGNQAGNNSTEGDSIFNMTVLTIDQRNQGNANLGFDNTAWYGMYSFDLVVGAADTTVRAVLPPDIHTGNTFTYFNDGFLPPIQSGSSRDGAYRITVPTPGTAVPLGFMVLVHARRRRR